MWSGQWRPHGVLDFCLHQVVARHTFFSLLGGPLEDQKRTSGEVEFTTPLSNNEAHLPNPHPKVSVEAMWGA